MASGSPTPSKIGGDPARIEWAQMNKGAFHCDLDLHIEHSGTLEDAGVPIGVVDGIVAIAWYEVEIRGFGNHSGTTPMPNRCNALIATSHPTLAVDEIVRREPGRQVGTVGQLNVVPNVPNVVPGVVRLTIELRDLDGAKIVLLAGHIRDRARQIAAHTNTGIEMSSGARPEAALATPEVQKAIETAAATLGLAPRHLPSGTGHDAAMMARLGPIGMIFVPSVGGISHSPRELTRWDDCARGADVLLHTVLDRAA